MGRPKAIRNEDVITYIKEYIKEKGEAPTRQAIQQGVPGPHKATFCRRLDEAQKAGDLVEFTHEEKPRYVPADIVKSSLEKIVEVLPPEKLYDVATEFFRGRNLSLASKDKKVDAFLVEKVHLYMQKHDLKTPGAFKKVVPLSQTDQRIRDYICEHVHASRSSIQEALGIKNVDKELKPRLKRIGFYESISYIHGPRGVKVYFFWDKVTDLEKEVYPYMTQQAAKRLRELEKKPGIIGEHDVLTALGYETVQRDYNRVAEPLLRLLYTKRAKQPAHEPVQQTALSEPRLISAEELLVNQLAEEISRKYHPKENLLKLARRVTKKSMGLEKLTQLLETQGYDLQEREGFYTLPSPVKKRQQSARVLFLSEVGYDTDFFDPEAYAMLLKAMAQDKDLSAVLIDGAVTRLDRPEVLRDELVYWFASEEHAIKESERIPNSKQYETMLDKQLGILEERLKELRREVPHAQNIYLQIVTDDWQDTISAMLNEMLVRDKEDALRHIKERKAEKKDLEKAYKVKRKEYEHTKEPDPQLVQEVADYERRLKDIEDEISTTTTHRGLYRPKKVRPAHQVATTQFIHYMTNKFEEVCQRAGVKLVTNATELLTINGLTIKWANSLDVDSWAVLKRPDKKLVELLLEESDKHIDVVAVSGHYGMGYKRTQRLVYSPEQGNHEQKRYTFGLDDKVRTGVLVLPFENQEKIARYAQGKEPERLAGGKPRGTRSHAAFKRMKNGSVSGVTVVAKNEEGIIGTEWIQYRNFITGKVLEQPESYSFSYITSDEHIGSPEEDRLALQGLQALYAKHTEEPTLYKGKQVFARGFISGGDTAEANTRKWRYSQEHRKDPEKQLKEVIERLSTLDTKDPEALLSLAIQIVNDAQAGKINSMKIITRRVADYYEGNLEQTLKTSSLQAAHVSVPGNHADDVLYDLGLKESDFFEERLRYREWQLHDGRKELVKVYTVGESDAEARKYARVFLGGYDNARNIVVPDYGMDVNGEPLFGPLKLAMHHDPKGSDFHGLEATCKKFGADLALAGHTHETWVKLVKKRDNEFSFAYRAATMQGATPTEMIFPSPPRTQAGHRVMMLKPGQLYEETLPGAYLRAEGERVLRDEIKWKYASAKVRKK